MPWRWRLYARQLRPRLGKDILLAPHRAVYEMTLVTTRGGTGVTAVSGRMVYELTGSVCEGYTQNMRFVTQMTNQGGTTMVTDLRSSSWEEGSGRRFRFNSSQFRDEKPTEATAGDAARANTADDIKVELTKPAKKGLSLSARVYFPIQHSIAAAAGRQGGQDELPRRPLRRLGEGREGLRHGLHHRPPPASGSQSATTAGQERRGARRVGGVAGVDRLLRARLRPAPMRVPVYELSFLFFENGVSRKLFIDYGEFSMRGELKEIVFHPPSKCEQKSPGRAPSRRRRRWIARADGCGSAPFTRHSHAAPRTPPASPHTGGLTTTRACSANT